MVICSDAPSGFVSFSSDILLGVIFLGTDCVECSCADVSAIIVVYFTD